MSEAFKIRFGIIRYYLWLAIILIFCSCLYAGQKVNNGAVPVIYNDHKTEYIFIPIDNKVPREDLEVFVSYWMQYSIEKPDTLFCYPECRGAQDCRAASEKFGKDILSAKQMLEKYAVKPEISTKEIAGPVNERVKYFSALLEFYSAVHIYWTESEPAPLVKCIKTRYPDAASMEREINNSRNSMCRKMDIIRKAFYTCGIEKRDRQPFDMFINADSVMREKGYYKRMVRRVSAL